MLGFWFLVFRIYSWYDDKGKKITKTNVSAPQYIDYVMTFCHKSLHDDAVFPTKFGKYVSYIHTYIHNLYLGKHDNFKAIKLVGSCI